jgi:hypothetical protein
LPAGSGGPRFHHGAPSEPKYTCIVGLGLTFLVDALALALSAIDIACFDLKGKAAGQSVCALLGGSRDRVPTYASVALMRQHPVDYLAKAGPRLRDMGFRQTAPALPGLPELFPKWSCRQQVT